MVSEEISSPVLGRFVWEKWCRVWYMGRIVNEVEKCAADVDSIGEAASGAGSLASVSASTSPYALHRHERQVKVHIHGEPDTNDKWFPIASANLEFLAVIPSEMTAVGAFPALNEHVELLLMDRKLHDLLLPFRREEDTQEGATDHQLTLLGRVVQVLPAHDASVVDIEYPHTYHHIVRERRVHIGNGYLKVISENEVADRQRRLEQALARAYTAEITS